VIQDRRATCYLVITAFGFAMKAAVARSEPQHRLTQASPLLSSHNTMAFRQQNAKVSFLFLVRIGKIFKL